MWKVEYYTDTGTHSDNEFIGIYNTRAQAEDAKRQYIENQIGTEEQYCADNDCEPEEYREELQRLQGCVVVEEVTNMY